MNKEEGFAFHSRNNQNENWELENYKSQLEQKIRNLDFDDFIGFIKKENPTEFKQFLKQKILGDD